MTKFPEFVARIEANPTGDGWEDTAFYPDPQEAKAKMKEIGAWLKTVETKSMERVPLDAAQLDGDTVMAIEQAADRNNEAGFKMQGKKVGGVPRSALLKPADAEQQTGKQRFGLGDRVVYVLDSGRVPIAMRGTVVGLTRTTRQTLLDVVFDSTFMSGTTLNDRCSPFRGSTVPSNAVLNLSDKQVLARSEAAKARAPQQNCTPMRVTGGNMASSYGAPDGPQLRQAGAPPPLRGSFRGAVAGMQDGGRGGYNQRSRGGGLGSVPVNGQQQSMPIHTRGDLNGGWRGARSGPNGTSSNRGTPNGSSYRGNNYRGGRGGNSTPNSKGFTIIDNSDPAAGVVNNNPNFRPQSYNNAPPAAGLDAPRGRGRGIGTRSRGGNGRGRGRGNEEIATT